jgi:hypothetical protein
MVSASRSWTATKSAEYLSLKKGKGSKQPADFCTIDVKITILGIFPFLFVSDDELHLLWLCLFADETAEFV